RTCRAARLKAAEEAVHPTDHLGTDRLHLAGMVLHRLESPGLHGAPCVRARLDGPPPAVRGTAQLRPAGLLRAALRRRADEGLTRGLMGGHGPPTCGSVWWR